ncbi:MAG: hypothetical protein ACKN85_08920, partial [Pirellula sp.]
SSGALGRVCLLMSRIEGFRQPNLLGGLLPFDSGENGINPNAGILKISKQISDRHPITMNVIIQKEPYNAF